MRLIIEVPDDQAPAIQSQMEQWGYPVQVETPSEWQVPQWQQDEVARRMAQPDRKPGRTWSEISESM